MSNIRNNTHAAAAEVALEMHNEACGKRPQFIRMDKDEKRTEVVDLLVNLMHYCALYAHDFEAALSMANTHFNEEQDDEQAKPVKPPDCPSCQDCGGFIIGDVLRVDDFTYHPICFGRVNRG